jgi:hypothetical protein
MENLKFSDQGFEGILFSRFRLPYYSGNMACRLAFSQFYCQLPSYLKMDLAGMGIISKICPTDYSAPVWKIQAIASGDSRKSIREGSMILEI